MGGDGDPWVHPAVLRLTELSLLPMKLPIELCAHIGLFMGRLVRGLVVETCHFCNADVTIPRSTRSGWYCRHCDQYNGFSEVRAYCLGAAWALDPVRLGCLCNSMESPELPSRLFPTHAGRRLQPTEPCHVHRVAKHTSCAARGLAIAYGGAALPPMHSQPRDHRLKARRLCPHRRGKLCFCVQAHVRRLRSASLKVRATLLACSPSVYCHK